ncbi:MAG: glycosyltransferase family 2 protein [Patescibacteria group bacterium]
MKKRIAVFIPAHNEGKTIADILAQIPKQIFSREVLIVVADDASTDYTANIARRYTEHVISMPKNVGVGATTKAGFAYLSKFTDIQWLVKLDADGQHLPNFIESVVSKLEDGADIVCCSRFHPESDKSKAPIDRILLNRAFSAQIKEITGWPISDARTGFMGFHFGDIQAIADKLITERYGIPMELLIRLWHNKSNVCFIEIPHPARYDRGISHRLDVKYAAEDCAAQAQRFAEGYEALLEVIFDLDITTSEVFSKRSARTTSILSTEKRWRH